MSATLMFDFLMHERQWINSNRCKCPWEKVLIGAQITLLTKADI